MVGTDEMRRRPEALRAKIDTMNGWRLVGSVWHGPRGDRLPAIWGGQDPDPFWLDLDLGDVTLGGVPLWELGEMTDWLNTTDWSRGVFDTSVPDFWADAATSGAVLADYGLTRDDVPFLMGQGVETGRPGELLGGLFVEEGRGIVDSSGQVIVNPSGLIAIERGIEDVTLRPGDSAAWKALTGALKPVNDFLGTPVGGILATLGLGGVGLALGSAISGGAGRFTPPAQQLTPGQQLVNRLLTENPQLSGVLSQALTTSLGAQQTVAQVLGEQAQRELMAGRDQAGIEADIRQQALQTMQAYLGGTPSVAQVMPGGPPTGGPQGFPFDPSGGGYAGKMAEGVTGGAATGGVRMVMDQYGRLVPAGQGGYSEAMRGGVPMPPATGGSPASINFNNLVYDEARGGFTDPTTGQHFAQWPGEIDRAIPNPWGGGAATGPFAQYGPMGGEEGLFKPSGAAVPSWNPNIMGGGAEFTGTPGQQPPAGWGQPIGGGAATGGVRSSATGGISRSVADLLAPVDPRQIAAQDPLTQQIRALVARQAGANLSGQPDEIAEGFRRSLTSLFGPGTTDPVTEALQARVLAAARGETPSPMLERLEREEMDQILNQFALRGPQYAESSAGIEKLARLRQMQTERRDNQILSTLSTLQPQLVQRELLPGQRAGQLAPLLQARETLPNLQLRSVADILGGREQGALGIAGFLANQAEQRRAGAQALAGTGRTSPILLQSPLASIASIPSITGVSDLNAGVRTQNDLNQRLAFAAFDAEQAARAGLGSGIARLFGAAAGAGFGLPR